MLMHIERLHSDSVSHQNSSMSVFSVRVSAQQTDADMQKIVAQLRSRVELKGFRKGHAPISFIQKEYKRQILETLYANYVSDMHGMIKKHFSGEKLLDIYPIAVEHEVFSSSGMSLLVAVLRIPRIPESVFAGLPSRIFVPGYNYESVVTGLERRFFASLRLVLEQASRPAGREDFVLVRCLLPADIAQCVLAKSMILAKDFLKEPDAFEASLVSSYKNFLFTDNELYFDELVDLNHAGSYPQEMIDALIGMRKGEKKTFSVSSIPDSFKGDGYFEGTVEVKDIFTLSPATLQSEDIEALGYAGTAEQFKSLLECCAADVYVRQVKRHIFDAIVKDLCVNSPVFVHADMISGFYKQIDRQQREAFGASKALFYMSYMAVACTLLASVQYLPEYQKAFLENTRDNAGEDFADKLTEPSSWELFHPEHCFVSGQQGYVSFYRILIMAEDFIWKTYFGETYAQLKNFKDTKYDAFLSSGGKDKNLLQTIESPLAFAQKLSSENATA